jgi:hypothetical protein
MYYPQGSAVSPGQYELLSPFQRSDGIWDGWNNIQGARAYDPSVGQWTAPYAYQGDIRDPISQRPYMSRTEYLRSFIAFSNRPQQWTRYPNKRLDNE